LTATAPGHVMRCDRSGCGQPATVEHDAWMFCSEHSGAQPDTRRRPAPIHHPTPPAPASLEQADPRHRRSTDAPKRRASRAAKKAAPAPADLAAQIRDLNRRLLAEQGYSIQHIERVIA
jgi:hypothetical protein